MKKKKKKDKKNKKIKNEKVETKPVEQVEQFEAGGKKKENFQKFSKKYKIQNQDQLTSGSTP